MAIERWHVDPWHLGQVVQQIAAAARASVAASGLGGTTVQVGVDIRRVTVTVRSVQSTDVPLVGLLVPDIVVEHSVVMQLEPP